MLNSDEGYVDKALVNSGSGYNYGVEYTLERFFDKNFYFLLTASLYDSKYKALDGKLRNTIYNGNYAFNFLIGKEFRIGNGGKANTLGVNTKFYYSGGRRYRPVNLAESRIKGSTVYDYSHAWENKLDDILQINLAISYRINRPKASHEFILDIANVTNAQGRIWESYDKYKDKIDYNRQLSLLPNIMYRIHF
jgi:outer membrane receptor protein involved in Fe transport